MSIPTSTSSATTRPAGCDLLIDDEDIARMAAAGCHVAPMLPLQRAGVPMTPSDCGASVRTVIRDAEVALGEGEPTRFPLEEVIGAAREVAGRIWQRARA